MVQNVSMDLATLTQNGLTDGGKPGQGQVTDGPTLTWNEATGPVKLLQSGSKDPTESVTKEVTGVVKIGRQRDDEVGSKSIGSGRSPVCGARRNRIESRSVESATPWEEAEINAL